MPIVTRRTSRLTLVTSHSANAATFSPGGIDGSAIDGGGTGLRGLVRACWARADRGSSDAAASAPKNTNDRRDRRSVVGSSVETTDGDSRSRGSSEATALVAEVVGRIRKFLCGKERDTERRQLVLTCGYHMRSELRAPRPVQLWAGRE